MANVADAKTRLVSAQAKLLAVRDDIHAVAADVEGLEPELVAEIKSTGEHVHRAMLNVVEISEGLKDL